MRRLTVVALLFVFASIALAQFAHTHDFQLDRETEFKKGIFLKVWQVLGKDRAVVVGLQPSKSGRDNLMVIEPFVLRAPTRGLVTDSVLNPAGPYRVTDTATIEISFPKGRPVSQRTVFVVEPVNRPAK